MAQPCSLSFLIVTSLRVPTPVNFRYFVSVCIQFVNAQSPIDMPFWPTYTKKGNALIMSQHYNKQDNHHILITLVFY